jgi:hypothetical protein
VTRSPARAVAVALSGYAAILGGAWLSYRTFGAEPFASDAGFVQRVAALLFALAGAAAFRLPALGFPVRALLATAAAWLAVDEWMMVHECLKFGSLAHLGPLRDAPILAYAAAGAVGAGWIALRIRPPLEALAHGALAVLAVAAVLLLDVGGVLHGREADVLEETAELLAAWGAIRCCGAAARSSPSATWRGGIAVAAWSVLWLGTVVWLLKPLVCAARFL